MIDGPIPCSPVDTHAWAIPPISIKFAVPETGDLRKSVESGLEEREEACEPDDE
jgi:hypothetical protein